jgi:excisionase family DNA binding protein
MDARSHLGDDREAVSIVEATRLTGLSRSTIYELIRAGRLRSVKVGRRRLIPRRSCADLFRAR